MSFFTNKVVGLDIADNTIEAAEVAHTKESPVVMNTGRIILEHGIVENGRIKNHEKLSKAVKEAFAKAKPHSIEVKKIIFGLPEFQVYTHVFELGRHSPSEQEALIAEEAKTSIPLKEADLFYSYRILEESNDRTEVLLVAASKEVVAEWQKFFEGMGLEAELFDIETLATFRGLFVKPPEEPICIIDIGANIATIAIFTKQGLRYVYSIAAGGIVITNEIAAALKISFQEAENLKKEFGIAHKKEKIFLIILNVLEPIMQEVKASFRYFKERAKLDIKEIILVGGSSNLKGIVEYFKTNLGISVWVGESAYLKSRTFLEFVEAIGLAIRGIDSSWDKTDPAFSLIGSTQPAPAKKVRTVVSPGTAEEKKVSLPDKKPWLSEEKPILKETSELEISLTGIFNEMRKIKFQKTVLLAILIIEAVIVGGLYGYKKYDESQRLRETERRSQLRARLEELDKKAPAAAVFESPTATTTPKTQMPEERYLTVKKTTTGWLTVRAGPGTNYKPQRRIYSGERYQFFEKKDNWYKIVLDDKSSGWVYGQYVSEVE